MFTASTRATRLVSFSFAVLMAVVVNGAMLNAFDQVAQNATLALLAKTQTVAVLETVTVLGRRI